MNISENKSLMNGKVVSQVNYKKKSWLLEGIGRNELQQIISSGAVCEVLQMQELDNDAKTMTIKFYFEE